MTSDQRSWDEVRQDEMRRDEAMLDLSRVRTDPGWNLYIEISSPGKPWKKAWVLENTGKVLEF